MIRSFAPWHRYFALLVLALAAPAYTPPPLMRTTLNPQSAQTCLTCHVDITQQWGSSAHAQADRKLNLLFGRMYFASLQETRGAARLHTKTVEEMAQDKAEARANASSADKGKMTTSGSSTTR